MWIIRALQQSLKAASPYYNMAEPTTKCPAHINTPKAALDTIPVSKGAELATQNLREIIRTAQWPSDIHGVVEKIAFRVHDRYVRQGNERPQPVNWEEAKDVFYSWTKRTVLTGSSMTLPEYLHEVLNEYAKPHKYCAGTDFDHWITAQNELADSICGYCLKK